MSFQNSNFMLKKALNAQIYKFSQKMTPVDASGHPQLCQSYKEVVVISGFHWKFWTFLHLNVKKLDEKIKNTKLIVKNNFVTAV